MRQYNTIQYNIRLLEAVRTQRRTIIEREKYVENENVKMVLSTTTFYSYMGANSLHRKPDTVCCSYDAYMTP